MNVHPNFSALVTGTNNFGATNVPFPSWTKAPVPLAMRIPGTLNPASHEPDPQSSLVLDFLLVTAEKTADTQSNNTKDEIIAD